MSDTTQLRLPRDSRSRRTMIATVALVAGQDPDLAFSAVNAEQSSPFVSLGSGAIGLAALALGSRDRGFNYWVTRLTMTPIVCVVDA